MSGGGSAGAGLRARGHSGQRERRSVSGGQAAAEPVTRPGDDAAFCEASHGVGLVRPGTHELGVVSAG